MTSSTATAAIPDDATLVIGVAVGDHFALAGIYDRYAGQLLGFCHSLLGRQSDAEDSLRDIFVIAADQLRELQDPSMLRAWLFAVARHVCVTRLEARALATPAIDTASAALPRDAAGAPVPAASEITSATDTDITGHSGATATATADAGDTGEIPAPAALSDTAEIPDLAQPAESVGPVELAEPVTPVDAGEPIDLFDGPVDAATLSYADQLPLELAERQQLADFEVAAALGVPRTAVRSIIVSARRSAGRTGAAVLLGEGRAFAAEMVSLRSGVLAAAADPGPLRVGGDWNAGWPPGDPAFAATNRPRRWGAPLAVLVVLLLALGAILGLLATSGGGHSAAGSPANSSPDQGSGGASLAGGSGAAGPTTVDVVPPVAPPATGGAALPPVPSAAPTQPTPVTGSPSPPTGMWTVTVTTDTRAIIVSAGRAQAGCAARTSCAYVIPNATLVTIADTGGGGGRLGGADTFSAPPSCVPQHGSCTFFVTGNLQITLKTVPAARIG